jgi:hypothetical protein
MIELKKKKKEEEGGRGNCGVKFSTKFKFVNLDEILIISKL